jgi:hypothetical protein
MTRYAVTDAMGTSYHHADSEEGARVAFCQSRGYPTLEAFAADWGDGVSVDYARGELVVDEAPTAFDFAVQPEDVE